MVPLALVFGNDDDLGTGADRVNIEFYPRQKIGTLSALADGELHFFDYPLVRQSNIMVDLGEQAIGGIGPDRSVVAFSNLCTHMGCPLTTYQSEDNLLGPCVCHFTSFDLAKDGQVIIGQATEKLPRLLLETEGDDVFATGVFRLLYGYSNNLAGEGVEIVEPRDE